MSFTCSSPDIKRGKSVSRSSARQRDSCAMATFSFKSVKSSFQPNDIAPAGDGNPALTDGANSRSSFSLNSPLISFIVQRIILFAAKIVEIIQSDKTLGEKFGYFEFWGQCRRITVTQDHRTIRDLRSDREKKNFIYLLYNIIYIIIYIIL